MIFTAALKTDLLPALALELDCETTLIPHEFVTAHPRTPPHLGIGIQDLNELEHQVLNIKLIIFLDICGFEQIFDILIIILLVTLLIAAFQVKDFCTQYQLFNVRPYTITAEFVRARGQRVKIALQFLFVANRAEFAEQTFSLFMFFFLVITQQLLFFVT